MAEGYVNGLKMGPKGTYIFRVKVNGKAVTGDTGFFRLWEAEQELIKRRAAILQDSQGTTKRKPPTVPQALELWVKRKSGLVSDGYLQIVQATFRNHIYPSLRGKLITAVSTGDLQDCLALYLVKNQKGKDEAQFRGYNEVIARIKTVFEVSSDEYGLRLCQMPQKQKSQEVIYDVLTHDEIKILIPAMEARFGLEKAVGIAMGAWMGLRVSEIIQARWNNIDWESRSFRNTKTKAKESKAITIPDELMQWLDKINPDHIKTGLIMPSKRGLPLDRKSLDYPLGLLCKELFGKDISPHGLRRSFITGLHLKGLPLAFLMQAARHKKAEMTLHYCNIPDMDVAAAVRLAIDGPKAVG